MAAISTEQEKSKRKRGDNLRVEGAPFRWQPGQSGNPGGRPKHKPFLEAIEKHIAEHPEDVTEAIRNAFGKAKSGELAHLRELADRVDGPVTTKQELTGADGEPLNIKITVVKKGKND